MKKPAKHPPVEEQETIIRQMPFVTPTSEDWERIGDGRYMRTILMTREELEAKFPRPTRKKP